MHQYTTIIGHYRQWKMPGEGPSNDEDRTKHQKQCFESFAYELDKIRNKSDNLLFIGDLNLDQLTDNEHSLRPELCALQPIFDQITISQGIKRLNNTPTCHFPNHKSSLLDLILSSDPQAVSNIKNIESGLSDHDGVICTLNWTDVEIQPQF